MNNIRIFLALVIAQIFLVACQKENEIPPTSLGECSYYPRFLWSDADTCGVTKRLKLKFSDDAKDDTECFAQMSFVDKDGNPIPDDIIEIKVDGNVLSNNTFRVYSSDTVKTIFFRFLPKAESGNYQGAIKLLSYKLDRFNSLELKGTPVVDMKWSLYFHKRMNPFACVIMWVCIMISLFVLIWFLFMRSLCYPIFGSIQKNFNVPGMAPMIVKFKGARMVVISSEQRKQSFVDAIIKGTVMYKTHPAFTSPITMCPTKGRKVLVKADSNVYRVSPNPMPCVGTATLVNVSSNIIITIN